MPIPPYRSGQRRRRTGSDPDERPAIPLPADAIQDSDAEIAADRQLQHWIDEAYEEYVRSGGFDNLPGLGKPLVVPTGDPFESILKNANVSPPWIMLRNETLKLLERAVRLSGQSPGKASDEELNDLIAHINKLIAEMNETAPSLSLHRRKVTRKTLAAEYKKWQ